MSFFLPCAGTGLGTCPNDLQSEVDVKGKEYYFNQIRALCIAAYSSLKDNALF